MLNFMQTSMYVNQQENRPSSCDRFHPPLSYGGSHSSVGSFVDHHRLSTGVHVVVHAEVGGHSVEQHPVVGRHGWELPLMASRGRHREGSVRSFTLLT